jgi:aquaporin Z
MHATIARGSRPAWPACLIEATLLGAFMISAVAFSVLVEHPAWPLRTAIDSALLRRVLIGLGMGATAVALIDSPWGRRSGAHMNPAVTMAFARLGLVDRRTAAGYILAQFLGGIAGVWLARQLIGPAVADPSVRFAVTTPAGGVAAALLAEVAMTATLMSTVLAAGRHAAWRPHAGLVAAGCVALFIAVEAPVSGMSLNPARTLASAVWAGEFTGLWIYFLAPALGMLLAAEVARHSHPMSKDSPCGTTT